MKSHHPYDLLPFGLESCYSRIYSRPARWLSMELSSNCTGQAFAKPQVKVSEGGHNQRLQLLIDLQIFDVRDAVKLDGS
jgi:hypothetical protein